MHFASTPIRLEISNINLPTPPHAPKEETITESVLHNTMQTLASEFKRMCEPKIQKFRGGTSSGALLMFKSWMQDIKCAIKDQNLNNDEALQLIKEFSEGCTRDNINFYLEVMDKPSMDSLFEKLWQVFHQEKTVNRCWLSSIVVYKTQKNQSRNSESRYCK